ncbi:cysteine-rich receptor-like protein kinase 34 [Phaseolus vulgaris]|uniref:cysteine-rich receptor-like protein kinase 34 n=1 Tax=Phaseolus vulgaris TaxID=3885 RepID=UPI0035C9E569
MAPEYAMQGLFSVKSDVFSFGVRVLQTICGRKNNGFYLSEHGQTLLLYAWRTWCEGKCLELMDPMLGKCFKASEVEKCIHIALLCVQENATYIQTNHLDIFGAGDNLTKLVSDLCFASEQSLILEES